MTRKRRRAHGDAPTGYPPGRALAFVALSASVLVVGLLPFQAAAQQSTPLFGLRPGLYGKTSLEKGHYQYAVLPRAHVNDSVTVINFTNETQRFALYGADMGQSGGALSPLDRSDKMRKVGRWLTLDRSKLTLGPRGKTTVGFRLDVSRFAAPGDHLGAVVASTKTQSRPGSVAVESRVALMVRVRIPGEAKLDGAVGTLRPSNGGGGKRFTVEVRNTGNLLFTTKGRVDIRSGESTVAVAQLDPASIYVIPGGKARFQGTWTGTPLFGKREAQAVFALEADEARPATRRSNVVSLSFVSVVVIVLALLGIVAVIAALVARRRRSVGERAWSESDELDDAPSRSVESVDWYER